MFFYEKIDTFKELDEILPMIEGLHKSQEYCRLFPHSAYLLWLTLSFNTPMMGIWVCYESDSFDSQSEPVGYIIATLSDIHGTKEVLLYEAYAKSGGVDVKKEMLSEITEWARSNGAVRLSMYTENEKVKDTMMKRYGFELSRYHLVKEV